MRFAEINANFRSIDMPELDLKAHGTFALDDRGHIRQCSGSRDGSQIDDILDLRFGERGKRQIAGFRHDGVLRRHRGGGGKEDKRVEAR